MKAIGLFVLLFPLQVMAGDVTIRPIPGVPGQTRVEDENGRTIYKVRPVPGTPYQRLEDSDGRAVGEIRPIPGVPKQYRFEEK